MSPRARGAWTVRLAGAGLAAALAVGCAAHRPPRVTVEPPEPPSGPVRGSYHLVRPGENLYRIAMTYGVELADLARVNGISDPARIHAGQYLFVPGATAARPVPSPASAGIEEIRPPAPRPSGPEGDWIWPVDGTLSSPFGPRRRNFHAGVDLLVPRGSPVVAARSGVVSYAGRRGAYGLLVIVDHGSGWSSYYGHNQKILVDLGQSVERGQTLALAGATGNATSPHVHFEIRREGQAVDPLLFLAPR